MCLLCLCLAHTGSAPPKLLFQQTDGLFDLLPLSVVPLNLGGRALQIIRHPKTSPLFENAHPVIDALEMPAGLPESLPPLPPDRLTIQQAVALDARHILPMEFG